MRLLFKTKINDDDVEFYTPYLARVIGEDDDFWAIVELSTDDECFVEKTVGNVEYPQTFEFFQIVELYKLPTF
jgi:hypothetical protein